LSGKLKEVRERIKSVNSTQQITKAMKMVSAAKLRKAQQAITEMRPYANKLDKMLKNILSNLDGDASTSFGVKRDVSQAAVVVVTSNRGLCGAFNTNIIKAAISSIEGEFAPLLKNKKLSIICIGKKGYDVLKKRYGTEIVKSDYVDVFADLSFNNVARVSQYLMDSFKNTNFDKVIVCYGHFKNAAMQFPTSVQFLPVDIMDSEKSQAVIKTKADYIFEPSKEKLLEELIPTILQTTFQKFLLDTHASEHGARMTAMDKASENAEELVKGLKIVYNKARQEAITKELSEIVAGAAALGG
jgi:F-type H+-transporting ATPase subunit gamma